MNQMQATTWHLRSLQVKGSEGHTLEGEHLVNLRRGETWNQETLIVGECIMGGDDTVELSAPDLGPI